MIAIWSLISIAGIAGLVWLWLRRDEYDELDRLTDEEIDILFAPIGAKKRGSE